MTHHQHHQRDRYDWRDRAPWLKNRQGHRCGGSPTTRKVGPKRPREEDHGRTRLVVLDRYPSKEALDEPIASGATSWNPETFDQLDELLVSLGVSTRR